MSRAIEAVFKLEFLHLSAAKFVITDNSMSHSLSGSCLFLKKHECYLSNHKGTLFKLSNWVSEAYPTREIG